MLRVLQPSARVRRRGLFWRVLRRFAGGGVTRRGVCVSVDAAGRVVEVRVDGVVDARFVSAYEAAVADRGAKLADVAADAYGEESREARALVEQYGSARSRDDESGPVVRGGVLRRGRRVGNTYGRGSL